jgi:hypothetical protein
LNLGRLRLDPSYCGTIFIAEHDIRLIAHKPPVEAPISCPASRTASFSSVSTQSCLLLNRHSIRSGSVAARVLC